MFVELYVAELAGVREDPPSRVGSCLSLAQWYTAGNLRPAHGRKPEFLTTDSPFRHLRSEPAVRRTAEGRSENQAAWAAIRGSRHAARAAWSGGHARRAATTALAG